MARSTFVLGVLCLSAFACSARSVDDYAFGETGDEIGSESATSETSGTSGTSSSTDTSSTDTNSTDTSSTDTSSTDSTTTDSSSSSSESTTGIPGDLPNGASCTSDEECMSLNCYVVPFLGGQCGECNQDSDCPDGGCTLPNPFESKGSFCNLGEYGAGCESSEVCMPGLVCANVLDLLGLIVINTCGTCSTDANCMPGQICASLADISQFNGVNDCIAPASLAQDAYCNLEGNGDQACASGVCGTIDIMGLAQLGACGECNVDADCIGGTCIAGEFVLDTGTLTGSTCQ